jgi:succinoglycan biosynthesis protein ExoM
MTAAAPPDAIVIGICTFRRPFVAETLASLAALRLPTTPVSIIVADNDDTPSAAGLIARIAADHPLPIRYIHAPARNISVARNAILSASLDTGARFLALLDDDETANPDWLTALLHQQAASGSAAVVGSVHADYAATAPRWMQAGRVHDTLPELDARGLVTNAYTCNVLLDLAVPTFRTLRFDPGRGRTGGEDTAFFRALTAAGHRITYAPDAILHEPVPDDRATLNWLLRRRYRMGQTHANLTLAGQPWPSRAAATTLAAAKAVACLGMAGLCVAAPVTRNRALIRGALHLGAVAELIGLPLVEIYGKPAPCPSAPNPAESAK